MLARGRTAARAFSRARNGFASRFSRNAAKSCGHRSRAGLGPEGTRSRSRRSAVRFLTARESANWRAGRRDVVAIPMGEVGLAGRILSLRTGSALAYAAVEQATAPGQLSLDAMARSLPGRADYAAHARLRRDRRSDRPFALAAAAQHRVSRAQDRRGLCAVSGSRICAISCGAIEPFGVAGFAVTIPHKETILRHLDDCDPLAARIGAVNTVVVRGGGRLYGYNTDYVGVLRSLESRMRLAGSRVLLFGAGGAARAAAFALAQAGSIVCLCARRPERARALARAVGAQVVERADLRAGIFRRDRELHAGGDASATAARRLRATELNCRIVMDMVYRPRETELLRLRARGRASKRFPGWKCFWRKASRSMKSGRASARRKRAMRRAVMAALDREEKSSRKRPRFAAAESRDAGDRRETSNDPA